VALAAAAGFAGRRLPARRLRRLRADIGHYAARDERAQGVLGKRASGEELQSTATDRTPAPQRLSQPPRERRPAEAARDVSDWDTLARLPVVIDEYALEPLHARVSSGFERTATVIRMRGGGEEGLGEDVTYDAVDHEALLAAFQSNGASDGPGLAQALRSLTGTRTLGEFSERLAKLELFPRAPEREVSRRYRRWAFESAALDLALRQAGSTLHAALAREPAPVRFVVSLRLGEPPSSEPVRRRLELYPWLQFKLDPTSSWDERLIAALAATGAVESVDFKGYYSGSIVDQPPDPLLYRRVVEAFPEAWIEDPAFTPQTEAVLAAHRARFSWDAPIHSVADIQALPYPPRMINIKPSRLGSLSELLGAFEYCAEHGIGNYGGGQFELGVGRGQVQYLASLFHPDAPNDVAPTGFNESTPRTDLPRSPLVPAPSPIGFRWETSALAA
jgi:L-alanine-DL-glutamate epimerase-like enolase superfamily enzyme